MIYLKQIISGGQTGADIGGLLAAHELGLRTGGWIPRNYKNELGEGQYWLKNYGLKEHSSSEYPPRTKQNILDSDGTVIFTTVPIERGSKLTYDLANKWHKPNCLLNIGKEIEPFLVELFRQFLDKNKIVILNVAGNRESKNVGIQERVKEFIKYSLKEMK